MTQVQLGPFRPHIQHEGPAESCVINGRLLGWTNCGPAAAAMGIEQGTLGGQRPDDCVVREATGDTIGGTTMSQVAAVSASYGVPIEVHVGAGVATPAYLAGQLHLGRGTHVQGNAEAMLGTPYRSTAGRVNHSVHVAEGQGWYLQGSVWLPREVLVYDPAADGRRAAWGKAADGPDWWPWATLLAFAAALRPHGDGGPSDNTSRLGPGAIYCGLLPRPKPAIRYARTAALGAPGHNRVRPPVAGRLVNVRSGPGMQYPVVFQLAAGDYFVTYQQTTAADQHLSPRARWAGSQDGKQWVHASGLRYIRE